MSELFKTKFKILFSVNILHHYFLDNGRVIFLFDKTKKQPELENYDVRRFLSIAPTFKTQQILKKQRMIFRATTMGLVILVSNSEVVKEKLEFVVVPIDPLFANYTALSLTYGRKQRLEAKTYSEMKMDIDGVEYEEKRQVLFKTNVFVFENVSTNNTPYLTKKLPIVAALPDNDFEIEQIFKVEGGGIYEGNGSGGEGQLREPLPDSFSSYADIPINTIKGYSIKGIELEDGLPNDVYAIVRIDPKIIDNQAIHFEIHLKNRSTNWVYFNKQSRTYEPLDPPIWGPLTVKGGHNSKRKAGPANLKVEKNDSGEITKLISEINP